jgi:hypothetical protein
MFGAGPSRKARELVRGTETKEAGKAGLSESHSVGLRL